MVLPDLHASLSDKSTNVLSLNSSNESLADRDFLNALSINDSFKILSINVGGLQKRLHGPDFERFIQFFPWLVLRKLTLTLLTYRDLNPCHSCSDIGQNIDQVG